ncbi:MAG TPA: hypothetical protein P5277_01130 [Candidatus Paceibacterota bacterium]|nr:hypothetical protein [Candidatus Paceibacterota bacterium]
MVNIWDPDYEFNPNNNHYLWESKLVNMNWKEFRTMYNSLQEVVKEEFDKYLWNVKAMEITEETRKKIEFIQEAENATSKNSIKFSAAA